MSERLINGRRLILRQIMSGVLFVACNLMITSGASGQDYREFETAIIDCIREKEGPCKSARLERLLMQNLQEPRQFEFTHECEADETKAKCFEKINRSKRWINDCTTKRGYSKFEGFTHPQKIGETSTGNSIYRFYLRCSFAN